MPNSSPQDRAKALLGEVEALAKRLQGDLKRRVQESRVARQLERAAGQLRKRAASGAAQVERYAHRLRVELEKGPARKTAAKRRKKAATRGRRVQPGAAAAS